MSHETLPGSQYQAELALISLFCWEFCPERNWSIGSDRVADLLLGSSTFLLPTCSQFTLEAVKPVPTLYQSQLSDRLPYHTCLLTVPPPNGPNLPREETFPGIGHVSATSLSLGLGSDLSRTYRRRIFSSSPREEQLMALMPLLPASQPANRSMKEVHCD